MFCQKCGAENDDRARECGSCGAPLRPAGGPARGRPVDIKNYLVESILVTIFCCLPLGIAAIVFAAQVNGKAAAGDAQGAQEMADKAKLFCLLSLVLGLVAIVGYVLLMLAGGGLMMHE